MDQGRLVLNSQCSFLVEFAGLKRSLGSTLGLCQWFSATVTLLREGEVQGFEMLL